METAQTTTTDIHPGDILASQWGYSMILVTFYQVMNRTAKTLTAIEIGGTRVEGSGFRGHVIPCPATHVRHPSLKRGVPGEVKVFTRKIHQNGNQPYISINESENAYKWDGEPCYYDHWD